MHGDEETATRDLMRLISWVDVDETTAEAAGALGRRYLRSHPGIEMVDLVIAVLVEQLDAQLLTTNLKHFPMVPDLRAPY